MYTVSLIGCGRIGFSLGFDKKREQPASHTMALLKNKNTRIEAGCDTDKRKLESWIKYVKRSSIYSDSDTMYARHKTDIITIAVNEDNHKQEAIKAIRTKPRLVILEKPVALNLEEAFEIQNTAQEYNVPVLINHERRFSEDYNLAKKYMKNIGDLVSINARLSSGMVVYDPVKESSGAYSLIHDGTHLVDIVLFLLEKDGISSIKEITPSQDEKSNGLLAKISSLEKKDKITVNSILNSPLISGIVRDEDNRVKQLSAHYSTEYCPDVTLTMCGRSKYFGFEVEINGTNGRICIGNGYMNIFQSKESALYSHFFSLARDKSVKTPSETKYFSNMIQNAVDFLDGKKELKSTIQTGINALAVLEEIKHYL